MFMKVFNGSSIMWLLSDSQINTFLGTDASLKGLGAWVSLQEHEKEGSCFRRNWPDWILCKHWSIAKLEFLSLLAALTLWADALRGRFVRLYCDNEAVVGVANRGTARDLDMLRMSRKLLFLQATFDYKVKLVHLTSTENLRADILSRSGMSRESCERCDSMIRWENLLEIDLPDECLLIQDHW